VPRQRPQQEHGAEGVAIVGSAYCQARISLVTHLSAAAPNSLPTMVATTTNPRATAGPFAREENDFNISTTEGDDRVDLRNKPLMDTDRLIFCRLTFFTFEFYKRNILLQLAQKATAGRGHDTGTCISGQATLRSALWHIGSSSRGLRRVGAMFL